MKSKYSLFSIVCIILALIQTDYVQSFSCASNDDCIGIDGMQCVENLCKCPAGHIVNQQTTKCIEGPPRLRLLSKCEEDQQCQSLFTGYHCSPEENVCLCRKGFRYIDGRCWPIKSFGENCIVRQECYDELMPFSLDCIDAKCACAVDHYEKQRAQCRKIVKKLNDGCILDSDCMIPEKEAICTNMKCVEKKRSNQDEVRIALDRVYSFLENDTFSKNLSRSVEGEPCESDSDCSALSNSECLSKICVCKRSYYISEDGKTCMGDLGQKSDSTSCRKIPMSLLENNVCYCSNGYFYNQHIRGCIKPTRNFEESCAADHNCYTFGPAGICVRKPEDPILKVCDCNTTISYKDESRMMCVLKNKVIGDDCLPTDECPLNAECIDDTCQCEDTHIPSPDNNCLVKDLELDQNCQITEQCAPEHSECQNGVCSCMDTYYANNGTCQLGIGGICEVDEECQVKNSTCDNLDKVCQCSQGFVTDVDRCLPEIENVGDSCLSDVQCWSSVGTNISAKCSEGKCVCTEFHHERQGHCYKMADLNQDCRNTLECYLPRNMSYKTICRKSICDCKDEYEKIDNDCVSGSDALLVNAILTIVVPLLALIAYRILEV